MYTSFCEPIKWTTRKLFDCTARRRLVVCQDMVGILDTGHPSPALTKKMLAQRRQPTFGRDAPGSSTTISNESASIVK